MKVREWRGIRDLIAAELKTDEKAGEITYGEPFAVAGASGLTKDVESSSEAKYYDNVPAIVIDSVGADTVKVDVSAVDIDVLAKLTGQFYDEETGMLVEGEREEKYFAIGYITEKTDGTEMFVWRLKGKFSIPSDTRKTKDNGTTSNGDQLTYTGINTTHKFTKTGKGAKAVIIDTEKNPLDEKEFFKIVQHPDTVKKSLTA